MSKESGFNPFSKRRTESKSQFTAFRHLEHVVKSRQHAKANISNDQMQSCAAEVLSVRVAGTSKSRLTQAVTKVLFELSREATERGVEGFVVCESEDSSQRAPYGALALRSNTTNEEHRSRRPRSVVLPDDYVLIWFEVAEESTGCYRLRMYGCGFEPGGAFRLTPGYVADGLLASALEFIWFHLSSALRLEVGVLPECFGLFPSQFNSIKDVRQFPVTGTPQQHFSLLLSKLAVSKNTNTVMRYRLTGHTPTHIIFEYAENIRTSGGRQLSRGSIAIDVANLGFVEAIRWTTDFALLLTFRSAIQKTSFDKSYPDFTEDTHTRMVYQFMLECGSIEDAATLKEGFLRLIEPTAKPESRNNSVTSDPSDKVGDSRLPPQNDGPFRSVEEDE